MATTTHETVTELDRLRQENEHLRTRLSLKNAYLRNKVNELLDVMGTKPLRVEELDDDMLLEMDPLGIIFNSIRHVLANLKETNAQLYLLNEETIAIFEVADVGIMVIDNDYRVQAYNPKMKELFFQDKEASEIKGDNCFHLLCLESGPPEQCVCSNVFCSDGISRIRGKKLREHVFDVAATPLKGKDGLTKGIVVVYHDITVLQQAQEALYEINAQLEQRVNERTALLQATNKELDAFAYSVSHDLRAPLRSLEGFSSALMEDYADKLDDTGKGYLKRIQAGSVKMAKLIDALLKLSRVTRSELTMTPVKIGQMAAEIASELQETDPARDVEFRINAGLTAVADGAMIKSVMENLLNNAWKFTSKTGKALIEFNVISDDAQSVFFVKDNGVGFSMEYVNRLFGAFQRLHRKDEFEGTGIGLATVQRIITLHGGRIWAEGEEGKGATFYFTLGGADL